jgi:2-isopropylmalate synthase
MEKKLRMTRDQVHEQARLAVRFARNLCGDIEFSPEDGYRSDPDFLCRVLETGDRRRRHHHQHPRHRGLCHPRALRRVHPQPAERIPNSDKAIWSVHCHNDLGMAVANSLAGVKIGGARQVECTINGLGERAGNCSLEEVVMAVRTRRDYFQLDLNIDTTQIVPASRMVSQTTGFVVQPNKAVVGANAFAHASGIHQDGVLKARDTYEIMRPKTWAGPPTRSCWASSAAATPSSSGCRNWASSWNRKPRSMRPSRASRIWPTARARSSTRTSWPWSATRASHRVGALPLSGAFAAVRNRRAAARASGLCVGDQEHQTQSDGNGPVDASLKAIESQVKSGAEMVLYSVNAITSGSTESQGEVTVRLQLGGRW